MRKTKCKDCNGTGHNSFSTTPKIKCFPCQGTGEVSVYTIQELREIERAKNFREKYIEEPEFKWGEYVEVHWVNTGWQSGFKFGCENINGAHKYVVLRNGVEVMLVTDIRKPQKITITLQEIAEKFGISKDQIKIVEE